MYLMVNCPQNTWSTYPVVDNSITRQHGNTRYSKMMLHSTVYSLPTPPVAYIGLTTSNSHYSIKDLRLGSSWGVQIVDIKGIGTTFAQAWRWQLPQATATMALASRLTSRWVSLPRPVSHSTSKQSTTCSGLHLTTVSAGKPKASPGTYDK